MCTRVTDYLCALWRDVCVRECRYTMQGTACTAGTLPKQALRMHEGSCVPQPPAGASLTDAWQAVI